MNKIRVHLKVTGKVQMVGYRWSAKVEADRLGVSGWVRNVDGGSVELECEGTQEQIDAFLAWCKVGTKWGRVDNVAITEGDPKGSEGFEIL